jgi:hypothetical protein
MLPKNIRDIGGGLVSLVEDGAIAHWNDVVPGIWTGPYTLTQVGSYISKLCEPGPGIYRLIGLDDANMPAVLNRLLGQDHTGTLYIGCEGKNFAVRSRLTKLVRSLRDYRYNDEHGAGYRLRSHPILSQRFPKSRLAITWHYTNECKLAEDCLLDAYFTSFGDLPPLNWRK